MDDTQTQQDAQPAPSKGPYAIASVPDQPLVTPLSRLPDEPANIDCPFCHKMTQTRVQKNDSSQTQYVKNPLLLQFDGADGRKFAGSMVGSAAFFAASSVSACHTYATGRRRRIILVRSAETVSPTDHMKARCRPLNRRPRTRYLRGMQRREGRRCL